MGRKCYSEGTPGICGAFYPFLKVMVAQSAANRWQNIGRVQLKKIRIVHCFSTAELFVGA